MMAVALIYSPLPLEMHEQNNIIVLSDSCERVTNGPIE
jgi:hypothetical protein